MQYFKILHTFKHYNFVLIDNLVHLSHLIYVHEIKLKSLVNSFSCTCLHTLRAGGVFLSRKLSYTNSMATQILKKKSLVEFKKSFRL